MDLHAYFADLEARIDPAQEDRIAREWLDFAALKLTGGTFRASRKPCPAGIVWNPILINDALDDERLMIYQQLYSVHETLAAGGGEMLCVRSNYGTGIIPTMFGAEKFIMPREANTLPGTRPLPDGGNAIRRILLCGKPLDFSRGYAGQAFQTAETYLALARAYPKVSKYIHYYNPDLQGPLALCEALWGSEFYLDFYDDSELLEDALDYFTEVYLEFTRRWHALCPTYDAAHSIEWGCLHRGGTIIRNDSAMNISGDMYREFIMPRDQKIIEAVGGGIHFCGRGDHYIKHVAEIRGLSCVNLSEPARNDMETIYRNTIDRDILIIGLRRDEVARARKVGRDLRGRVHEGASVAAWLDKRD